MAEKKGGKKLTEQMGAFADEPPAPSPKGGKSKGGLVEGRGLAAFDKKPAVASSHGAHGSAAWSGGGGGGGQRPPRMHQKQPVAPVPVDDDDDLRRQRLEAHEIDDDGMVPVSSLAWGDEEDEEVAHPDAVEVEEEEAPAPRRRSNAWKWIVGVGLLGGAGAAVAVVATSQPGAGTGAGTAASTASTSAAHADAAVADTGSAEEEASAAAEVGAAGVSTAADGAAAPDGAAETVSADVAPSGPAAWAPDALAKNPAVDIAAAPAGRLLGLRDDEANDHLTSVRTGFRPGAKVQAPTKPFKLQAHEVTWGELALATTIPDLATLDRPKWLPKSARRAVLPATGVPWALARAYCQALGGDLPSEAEWEWAARGADDRYFPWGPEAVDTHDVHIFAEGSVPVVAVGTSKLDRTPAPVLSDLLGNAQEWTRDAWSSPDAGAPPDPRAKTHKAVRGWPLVDAGGHIPAEGSTYRAPGCADPACMASDGAGLDRVGFRCVLPP